MLFIFCFLSYSLAHAGYFVDKSIHSPNYIVVGRGTTPEEAYRDAMSALPQQTSYVHYERDPRNSPVNQCMEGGAPDKKLKSCGSVAWQTVVPLIRVER